MNDSESRELAMFAKYWQPRQVKTRLGGQIGFEAASQLYRMFVLTLLRRLTDVGQRRTLVFAPESRRQEFERICHQLPWELALQSGGDLGDRMSHYFRQRLAVGSRGARVVLIGSDSPTIPTRLIDQAFDELEHHDVVLGPSCDGGYYLIGSRKHLPALFSDIDWSTERVWQQTLDRLESTYPQLAVQVLQPWYDVDSKDDVHRLYAELLENHRESDAQTDLFQFCRDLVAGMKK